MNSNYPNNFNGQTNIYSNNFNPGNIIRKPNSVNMDAVISNPNKEEKVKKVLLVINSKDRNLIKYPNQNSYTIKLTDELHSIKSVELISHDIPNSDYNINSNNNVFYIHEYDTASVVTEKNYNASVQINEREQVSPKDYNSITPSYSDKSIANKIYKNYGVTISDNDKNRIEAGIRKVIVEEGNCSSGIGLAEKIQTAFNTYTNDVSYESDGTTVNASWASSNSFKDSASTYSVNYNSFNDKITIKLNKSTTEKHFQMFFFKQDKAYDGNKYIKKQMINHQGGLVFEPQTGCASCKPDYNKPVFELILDGEFTKCGFKKSMQEIAGFSLSDRNASDFAVNNDTNCSHSATFLQYTGDNIINLDTNKEIILNIPTFKRFKSVNKTKHDSYAIINYSEYYQQFLTSVPLGNIKYYNPPLPKLSHLTLSFKDSNGNSYNFRGRDHTIILQITILDQNSKYYA